MRAVLAALLLLTAAPLAAAAPAGSLDGVPIVDTLDAASVPRGQLQRFWFRAGRNAIAQSWLVPVIVINGARPGPKLLVTAGIHGDELNGISVIHRMAAQIDPKALAGTLVMVPGLNTPGLLASTRTFPDGANLNRELPGDASGAADRYVRALWDGLLRPNADAAVDFHTQSRGTTYVMYAFASTPRTRRMAELVGPDIVKMDTGDKGTVENELTNAGVPAITYELGSPEVFDETSVRRGLDGLRNLMTEMGMIGGSVQSFSPFLANRIEVARVGKAGWMTLLVPLGADVKQGQPIATIADAFGTIIETVNAPASGRINTIATDPRRDAGDMVARIVWWDPDPKCALGC